MSDPFEGHRRGRGVLRCPFGTESIVMLLRHGEVREAAKDWQRFTSAVPFRVPIPSEEDLRSVRQLPIETDPPEHDAWRALVEPFFRRPRQPEVVAGVRELVGRLVGEAVGRGEVEVVREFALPLQSKALSHLLAVPEAEADEWIGWGIHVFHDGEDGGVKGASLERYLNRRFDQAAASPGDDFFSAMATAEIDGRPLSREEMLGIGNLTFAGGRDTVIHSVSSIVAHLGRHPEVLPWLREDPRRVVLAAEEFFRVVSPLTHIGRVFSAGGDLHGESVAPDERISLCWASANRDAEAFENPRTTDLARKPNPHLAFGAGPHFCLGAAHARLVVRSLLEELADRVGAVELLEAEPHVETTPEYRREVGYDRLRVRLAGRVGGVGPPGVPVS